MSNSPAFAVAPAAAPLSQRIGLNPRAQRRGVIPYAGAALAVEPTVPAMRARQLLPVQVTAALDAPVSEASVIAVDAGGGKSHALITVLIERALSERGTLANGGVHRTTLLLLPNKALAREWAARVDWRGVRYAILEGKDAGNCRSHAIVAPLQAVGARVAAICGDVEKEETRQKHAAQSCARRPSDPRVIVVATQALANEMEAAEIFDAILTVPEREACSMRLIAVDVQIEDDDAPALRELKNRGFRFARRARGGRIRYVVAGEAIAHDEETRGLAQAAGCAVIATESPMPRSKAGRAIGQFDGAALIGYIPAEKDEETLVCQHRDWCQIKGYHAQAAQIETAEIIISNHAWLTLDHGSSFLSRVQRLETIVIDESPLGVVVSSRSVAVEELLAPLSAKAPDVAHRLLMLSGPDCKGGTAYKDRIARVRENVKAFDEDRREMVADIVKDLEEGRDPAHRLVVAGKDAKLAEFVHMLAGFRGQIEDRIRPGMSLEEAREVARLFGETAVVGKNIGLFTLIRRRAELIRKVAAESGTADLASVVFPSDPSMSIGLMKIEGLDVPIRDVRYDWVSPVFVSNIEGFEPKDENGTGRPPVRVVVLDASAHAEIYERLFARRAVKIARTRLSRPNVKTVQIVDSTFSNTALIGRPDPHRLDPDMLKAAGKLAARSLELIDRLAQKHNRRGLLVCATQGVLEMIEGAFAAAMRQVPEAVAFLNYGRARGTNDFEAFEAVLCLGRVQPPKDTVERKAGALESFRAFAAGEAPRAVVVDDGPTFPLRAGIYRKTDGTCWEKAVPLPTDDLVRAVLATHREDEVAQAAARLRPATRAEDVPATIYIATSLPLDFEVDELVVLDDLLEVETPLAKIFRAFDGVLPTSPALVALRAKGSLMESRTGYRRAQNLFAAAGVVTADFIGSESARIDAIKKLAPLGSDGLPLIHVVRARYNAQRGSDSVLLIAATVSNVEDAVRRFYNACGLKLGLIEILYSPAAAEIVLLPTNRDVALKSAESREALSSASDPLTPRLARAYRRYLAAAPGQAAAMGASQAHHDRRLKKSANA